MLRVRPLDAADWSEVPLAIQLEHPDGAVVLLRLTLKRRKTASCSSRSAGARPCLSSGRRCRIASLPLGILQPPHEAARCMVRHEQCWSFR